MPVIIDGTSGITTPAVDTTTAITAADGGTGLTSAGTAGNVLTSNGTTWTSAAAASGQLQTQLFTAPGTWTKPASCSQVRVTVIGGGGGAVANNPSNGGYGGAIIASVPVSAPVSVTVGSGGVAAPGGTSSFGPLATATGGVQGGNPGTGANGTASTTGTDIKLGNVSSYASPPATNGAATWSLIYGGTNRNNTSPTAQTYSSTSTFIAGVGGAFPSGAGISGAVLVEFVG